MLVFSNIKGVLAIPKASSDQMNVLSLKQQDIVIYTNFQTIMIQKTVIHHANSWKLFFTFYLYGNDLITNFGLYFITV